MDESQIRISTLLLMSHDNGRILPSCTRRQLCAGERNTFDPYQTMPTPQDPRAGMQYATRAHPGKIVSGVRSSIRYDSRAIGVPGSVVLTLIGTLHRAC